MNGRNTHSGCRPCDPRTWAQGEMQISTLYNFSSGCRRGLNIRVRWMIRYTDSLIW